MKRHIENFHEKKMAHAYACDIHNKSFAQTDHLETQCGQMFLTAGT